MHSIQPGAWHFYARFYRKTYRWLLLSVAISAMQSLLVVPSALVLRFAFDTVIPAKDMTALTASGFALVLLNALSVGANLCSRYITLRTTKLAIRDLRAQLLEKLYQLSRDYLTRHDSGSLHTLIVQDSERLDVMSNAFMSQVLPSAIVSTMLVGVLFYLNPLLCVLALLGLPCVWLLSRWMSKSVRAQVQAFHRAYARFSEGVLFALQQIDLTRLQAAEPFERTRQVRAHDELRIVSARMAWQQTAYGVVQNILLTTNGMGVLIVGGALVAQGAMSLGALLSFFFALSALTTQLGSVVSNLPFIISWQESLFTLYRFMQTDAPLPYAGTRQLAFAGNVEFDGVCFGYAGEHLLSDVDLTLRRGEIVAIVGANGTGKSTLVQLLLGFYRPTRGEVRVDGQPLAELDLISLRRQIGTLMQDPIIFPATVRENITYGEPGANATEVERAARAALAHDLILHLPHGYETLVGEHGVLLSGGQRQRVALARALLRRPPLLILDEPTNHLDAEAVSQLVGHLRTLEESPAILLISHAPEVAAVADRIYRLQDGRLQLSSETMNLPLASSLVLERELSHGA
ncbi:MAG: ABC transporter ATP-binding protein/permease [Chloroflexi bacterium]|nr:ABC transporter ATP-binding protein/permease [Chloroflexota bacterium]